MKTFNEFLLEKRNNRDTGINRDILELSKYLMDIMTENHLKKQSFKISELSEKFPFLKSWNYNTIDIWINPTYINKILYLSYSNSIIIFLKSYSRGTLNHELTHALQSTTDDSVLLIDYENNIVLSQIRNFFTENRNNIDLLKGLLYFSDEREMEAFIQAFKKYDREKKVEILSYALLLKYFNLRNVITDERSLRQFVTIWYQYYGTSIPFFDRLSLQHRIRNNTLEVNKKEVNEFIQTINTKLNKIGNTYMRKLSNQYNDTDVNAEKFVKLLNKAKLNITRNEFKNLLDLSNTKPNQNIGW
jgi:hypothetical protein